MDIMRKKLFCFIAFFLIVGVGEAQTDEFNEAGLNQTDNLNNEKYWVDAGLGFFISTKDASGLSLNLGANVIQKNILGRLKISYYSAMNLGSSAPLEKYHSIGILVGKAFTSQNISIQLSGGLGITRLKLRSQWQEGSNEDGTYVSQLSKKETIFSPSIPLEVVFMVKPLKYMGMGVSLFADLNIKRPMCGVIFKIDIGRI